MVSFKIATCRDVDSLAHPTVELVAKRWRWFCYY